MKDKAPISIKKSLAALLFLLAFFPSLVRMGTATCHIPQCREIDTDSDYHGPAEKKCSAIAFRMIECCTGNHAIDSGHFDPVLKNGDRCRIYDECLQHAIKIREGSDRSLPVMAFLRIGHIRRQSPDDDPHLAV